MAKVEKMEMNSLTDKRYLSPQEQNNFHIWALDGK